MGDGKAVGNLTALFLFFLLWFSFFVCCTTELNWVNNDGRGGRDVFKYYQLISTMMLDATNRTALQSLNSYWLKVNLQTVHFLSIIQSVCFLFPAKSCPVVPFFTFACLIVWSPPLFCCQGSDTWHSHSFPIAEVLLTSHTFLF